MWWNRHIRQFVLFFSFIVDWSDSLLSDCSCFCWKETPHCKSTQVKQQKNAHFLKGEITVMLMVRNYFFFLHSTVFILNYSSY